MGLIPATRQILEVIEIIQVICHALVMPVTLYITDILLYYANWLFVIDFIWLFFFFFPFWSCCYLYITMFVNKTHRNTKEKKTMYKMPWLSCYVSFYKSYKNVKLHLVWCDLLSSSLTLTKTIFYMFFSEEFQRIMI